MSDSLLALLSAAATIVTVGFFLTPLRGVRQYYKSESVGNANPFPFVATFINCTLWTKYGVLQGDTTLVLVNGTGLLLATIYVGSFYRFTNNPSHLERLLIGAALIVYPVLFYARFTDPEAATRNVGLIACVFAVIMFGAPLSTLKNVIATRNASSMSLPLSIMSVAVTSLWTLYGTLQSDSNIIVPNALGLILALVQVAVILYFRQTDYRRIL